MSRPRLRVPQLPSPDDLSPTRREIFHRGFDDVRRELDIIEDFSADALAEATAAEWQSARAGRTPGDHRHLPFVTIDPPESLDLDQAYTAARRRDGYVVHYAIADPAAFVRPGGALDLATRERGVTMYAPDHNTPLHPRSLSEGAASLLPGQDRPAVLWTIELDGEGRRTSARLERTTIRSREKLSYGTAQDRIDTGSADEALLLLREIGELRVALERERGGVSLSLPSQEVVDTDHGYDLRYDESLPVEDWNAQISLLTGMAAGDLMLDAGVGLLRTLPPPPTDTLTQIRRHGLALGVDWPRDV
ncbi:MAG: RNB domain-containing ribonuclease, partial [Actinomycetota bacterium]|nr:RNB domain-containing ribonuclease [Actinomycetota bacterium]